MIHGHFENFDGAGLMHCACFHYTVHGRSPRFQIGSQRLGLRIICILYFGFIILFSLLMCFLPAYESR
jgi:hypothetical protein